MRVRERLYRLRYYLFPPTPETFARLRARKNAAGLIAVLNLKRTRRGKLHDSDRVRAASALGAIGERRAVGPLIQALRDTRLPYDDWGWRDTLRGELAQALAGLGDAAAIAPLVEALEADGGFREPCVSSSLAKFGPAAFPALVDATRSLNTKTRATAASTLGRMGDARVIDALSLCLKDPEELVRRCAAYALARIGDPRCARPLVEYLEHDPQIEPLKVLGERLRGKRVDVPLLRCLKSARKEVRNSACMAADYLGWVPGTTEEKAYYLAASQRWSELGALGPAAVDALLLAVLDFPSEAAPILAEIGDTRALPPLAAALETSPSVPIALAIARIGRPSGIERLIELLQSESAAGCAVVALGVGGDSRAIEPLAAMLGSGRTPEVIEALGKIGGPRALGALIGFMRTPGFSTEHKETTLKLGGVLAAFGAKAAEPLISLLKDPAAARDVAAAVLADMKWEGSMRVIGAKAAEPLISLLKEPATARDVAAAVLADMKCSKAAPPLIAILTSGDAGRVAAKALGRIGGPAIAPLCALLQHADWRVRVLAADALEAAGAAPDNNTGRAYYFVVTERWSALETLGEAAVEPLRERIRRFPCDSRTRAGVLRTLARIGDKRAAEAVLDDLAGRPRVEHEVSRGDFENLFEDYTDLVLGSFTYGQDNSQVVSETPGSSKNWSGPMRNSLDASRAAVEKLCGIRTRISSNLLHLVGKVHDFEVVVALNCSSSISGKLSFEEPRRLAQEELAARGNPPYDARAYLEAHAWRL